MIDYSGFTSLAGALLENKTIQSLHLNGNFVGALGAAALTAELHLHGNAIGNEGDRASMTGLSAHKGKFTLLYIGNNEIGAKGAFYVAEYIKKSKNLLWLNLYMNDIGDEGAEKITDALKENQTITTVDLGGNNIHAMGVTAVAQVLKDNLVIKSFLFPVGTWIQSHRTDGAKALAEVLKFHGKIEILKLGWCQRVSRSLRVVNEALTSLDLGFNEIRDKGAYAIAQALMANEDITLTSLNLASNFLTKYGQLHGK
ncbi:Nlr family card domain containing [Thalictrum thalictroides]|uniref:Nlr family card domain containing n=1 Tax=Thalictrum thalictroides TaxID=46969 RepID=A0A7J6WVS6_THATH|nr:Nlr family card domain containing [Thalictrum thalictroides]